jgi:hypothetical protein
MSPSPYSEEGVHLRLNTNVAGHEQYHSQPLTKPILVLSTMLDANRLQESKIFSLLMQALVATKAFSTFHEVHEARRGAVCMGLETTFT